MTEPEILDWLGFKQETRPLAQWVLDALKDEPVPTSPADQVRTFRAFLRGADMQHIKPGPEGSKASDIAETMPGRMARNAQTVSQGNEQQSGFNYPR